MTRRSAFTADVAILYGALSFRVTGTIDEVADRGAGRYEVTVNGQGTGLASRITSKGLFRDGRWVPRHVASWFQVAGRESRSDLTYDWARGVVEYHSRAETFFLRRIRVADDLLRLPEGVRVDDVLSATLNYADGLWAQSEDGTMHTHIVRRQRAAKEGPDDVQPSYRAELVPFALKVTADRETGKPTALIDMTRFSSWAREGQPARIVFNADRRPESVVTSLMLGTSINVRLA